ncbi:YfcC family protein [Adlercreutzia sp. ZJ138]|uniref:YfcC family protein n=1 Tax=Adlercreutzia sp. ZJ138 TaxID=2709405 RepID=UPI0013ED3438|nr:YfcC family protein [Adlercreutzia sp. ZJ138]
MSDTAKKSRKKRSISSFTILLIMLVVLAILTLIMAFTGTEGIEGATLSGVLTAPVKGFTDALPICLFVIILGGFLGVVTETGALDAGIAALVKKMHGNELILIPILMFIFSIGGTTYGMLEETVPFYLLLAATMVAAGFDSMVGASVVLLGAGCGVLGSTVNPFAIGAAVDSLSGTGLEVNQGIIIGLGAALWLISLAISIVFVMRYAKKVKADKGSTILSLQEQEVMNKEFGEEAKAAQEAKADPNAKLLSGRQKATLIVFGLTFLVMVISFIPWEDLGVDMFNAGAAYEEVATDVNGDEITAVYDEATDSALTLNGEASGVAVTEEQVSSSWSSFLTGLPLGQWYFDEASTWFLLMAIIIGLIGGISESRFVKAFVNGCASMMSVVLIIALARSITVLMAETGLSVWILENAANALAGMSAVIFAPLSYLLYIVLSFLIPSSSGMATVSMPIMGPLASHLGFSVETMVVIFSAGNGLVNLFTPTCGAIMGGLAIAKIEYSTWLKFGAKLFIILGVVSMLVLTAAMVILQ